MSLNNLIPDDATPEEVEIVDYTITALYRSAGSTEDKFLVSFVWDNGYKQSLAAKILGISDATVSNRLKKIQERLAKYVKNKR